MVREDSARADWFREIPLVKADPVDRVPAEDAVDREEEAQAERAASEDPVGVVEVSAELLAECLAVEEVVAPVEEGAAD